MNTLLLRQSLLSQSNMNYVRLSYQCIPFIVCVCAKICSTQRRITDSDEPHFAFSLLQQECNAILLHMPYTFQHSHTRTHRKYQVIYINSRGNLCRDIAFDDRVKRAFTQSPTHTHPHTQHSYHTMAVDNVAQEEIKKKDA